MHGYLVYFYIDFLDLKMAGVQQNKLYVCSFNCRSFKSSLNEVHELCVMVLQCFKNIGYFE